MFAPTSDWRGSHLDSGKVAQRARFTVLSCVLLNVRPYIRLKRVSSRLWESSPESQIHCVELCPSQCSPLTSDWRGSHLDSGKVAQRARFTVLSCVLLNVRPYIRLKRGLIKTLRKVAVGARFTDVELSPSQCLPLHPIDVVLFWALGHRCKADLGSMNILEDRVSRSATTFARNYQD